MKFKQFRYLGLVFSELKRKHHSVEVEKAVLSEDYFRSAKIILKEESRKYSSSDPIFFSILVQSKIK